MSTLVEDLKSGTFQRVYLLYGEEAYLKRYYRNKLTSAAAGGDSMNVTVFSGKDIPEDDVISAADTLPFFAERRLVVVDESGWFKASLKKLPDFLPSMPESTVLLFIESAVDKRNRLYKAVQTLGSILELKHPEGRELSVWAAAYLARAGKKITPSTMDHFLDMVGNDMENVENELEKLISYVGDSDVVDRRAVDTITTVLPEDRVFQMVDAVTDHRERDALRYYGDLLALKVSPTLILYLTAKRYQQLLNVKNLMDAGRKKTEIAQELKLREYAAGKLMSQARPLKSAALFGMLRRCVEYEERVKTGDLNDRMAVELLLCGS